VPAVVYGDAEPSLAGNPADHGRGRRAGPASLLRDHERPQRLPQIAKAYNIGLRDLLGSFNQALRAQPLLGLLRRPEAIPIRREVVVVGVDEALQQLEPAGRLGPASRLDLLANEPPLALLDQTSITRMLVR
jgi:hypothetical protein